MLAASSPYLPACSPPNLIKWLGRLSIHRLSVCTFLDKCCTPEAISGWRRNCTRATVSAGIGVLEMAGRNVFSDRWHSASDRCAGTGYVWSSSPSADTTPRPSDCTETIVSAGGKDKTVLGSCEPAVDKPVDILVDIYVDKSRLEGVVATGVERCEWWDGPDA